MKTKRALAAGMGGGLAGGTSGAMIGTAVAPGIGTAIGGGIGAVGGALAGLFGASADDEDMRNDPEYQAAQRRERTMKMMSVALGHAFSAARPKTAQGALEPARMGV